MLHPLFYGKVYYLSSKEIIDDKTIKYCSILTSKDVFIVNDPTKLDAIYKDTKALLYAAYFSKLNFKGNIYMQLTCHDHDNIIHIDELSKSTQISSNTGNSGYGIFPMRKTNTVVFR